ncbi:glycoside hydrolase family 32 protein [Geochorda subterranea]|uniref:beta-fructofuranosidase n=1 Tax=Geochorda subterranea TaxID=3109564 RepID=A0ABZ1BPL7_9FIRM|nr:glycoside hydrolase family 32 protein [Limnochorda sp. LNt]WRP14535.1 glycoside hydrolase family 32 protein [Limnochorda sp. LNt]
MEEALSEAMGQELHRDPHRPAYHFVPPANWMNDPNGLIQWRGEYHMFYQHNPHAPVHEGRGGTIYWGHAVSQDLVHWRHLPIALAPGPTPADSAGVWSGCAVDNGGVLTLVYTGVDPEVQCLATSTDGVHFTKYSGNPVIGARPEGFDLWGFRDPYVWKEDDGWYMALGSGIKGVGGAVLLYRSTNLYDWSFLHPLCVGKLEETGYNWECPNFFALDGRHVLIVSPHSNPIYFVGKYERHRFEPERWGVVDYGPAFYAPQVFIDDRGRPIMFGWLKEQRSEAEQIRAGWSGVMSLPRILSLRHDGTLGCEPAPEVQLLRAEHWRFEDLTVAQSAPLELSGVRGDALEILAEFVPNRAGAGEGAHRAGLSVLRAPDGSEQTIIEYDQQAGCLRVGGEEAPLQLAAGEALQLRVFVDRSVVEVFANGRVCIATRVYPQRPDCLGVALVAQGGQAYASSVDVWRMNSIWP